jgi:hypothetical protein
VYKRKPLSSLSKDHALHNIFVDEPGFETGSYLEL